MFILKRRLNSTTSFRPSPKIGYTEAYSPHLLAPVRPKFHLARLYTTRHVRLCPASRAIRAVLFQHGGRRTNYSINRLYKFSHAYANPICSVK